MSSLLVHELYTPLEEARTELARRRNDAQLVNTVREWERRLPPPPALQSDAHAVYAPTIISPNLELLHLLESSDSIGLPLHLFEFSHDKFVHMNHVKRCLGQLTFVDASRPPRVIAEKRIVDFQLAQGKYMDEIQTLDGENFVDFHHRLLRTFVQRELPPVSDFSVWFAQSKLHTPHVPYARYLALFICDGMLLANFTTEKHEVFFTEQVVLPAFRHLREHFGVKPLIIPVSPPDSDESPLWNYYPADLLPLV